MGIFISCVSKEFHGDTSLGAASWPGSYRRQLARFLQQCGQHVVHQETFAQGNGDLLAKLENYIAGECRAVIHLIGQEPGWSLDDELPPNSLVPSDAVHALLARHNGLFINGRPVLQQRLLERGFRGISATQWEAYLAIHHNKPLLVFTFTDIAERAPSFTAEMTPREDRLSQAKHFELLKLTNFDRTELITNQHEFKEAAIASLVRTGVLSTAETVPQPRCSEFSSIGSLFIGRQEAMDALRASLRHVASRATAIVASQVIHGQGGIGKTRLAIEFGLSRAEEYSALLFVRADSPQSLETNLANLTDPLATNLPDDAKMDEKLAAVLHWLRKNPGYFLILDNVDSEEAAQAVEDKLALFSEGHVVITSRITQWSASVAPLHLKVISEDDSTEFLLRATERKAGSGRVVTATDEADARLLAQDVAGLALALEQSAAFIRTKQTTFAKYRQRWAEFDVRVRDFKDHRLSKYPHSVLTTWAATFEQLTDGAVKLLRACSVLAHEPIPLFLIESVDSECEDDLAELGKFSLAERSDDGSSIQVHKVVQEIVRFRMEEPELRDRIKLLLDSLFELYAERYDYTHETENQRMVAMVHAEACIGHAKISDSRQTDESKDFTAPLFQFTLAKFQTDIGQCAAALAHTNQALDWALNESEPNESVISAIRISRSNIRRKLCDHSGALEDIESAMRFELQQTSVCERRLADCRYIRALIRVTHGNLTDALDDIAAAINAYTLYPESPESEAALISMLDTQANLLVKTGDIHGAHQAVNCAIDKIRQQSLFNGMQLAHSLSSLATVLAHLGKFAEAVITQSEAIELLQSYSYIDEVKIAQWRVDRAQLRNLSGDVSTAQEEIGSVLEWAARQSEHAPDFQYRIAGWFGARAEIRIKSGNFAGALQDVNASIEYHFTQTPVNAYALATFISLRASVQRSLGDLPGALEDTTAAIDLHLRQSPVNEFRLRIEWQERAEIRQSLGDVRGALEDVQAVIDSMQREVPVDERSLAVLYYKRSLIKRDLRDLQGALEDVNLTIDLTLKQVPVNEDDLAIGREQRAYVLIEQGKLSGAIEDITAAIDLKLRQSPVDERFVAFLQAERATFYRRFGDLKSAIHDIDASVDCELRQQTVDQKFVATRRLWRSAILRDLGDHVSARDDADAVVAWAVQQTPIDEGNLADGRAIRASIFHADGELSSALLDITSVIEWYMRQTPVDERSLAVWRATLAAIQRDLKDLPMALQAIEASLEWELRQSPVVERNVATSRVTLASIQRELRNLDAALSTINLAIEWFVAQSPPNEHWLAKGRATRSRIYHDLNRITEAHADIAAALEWYETHLPGDTRTINEFRQIRDMLPNLESGNSSSTNTQ